jgi:DNA-3-methyladenine glycosylase II
MSDEILLGKLDPVLAKIIATIPKPVIASTNNMFHDLMSCIIEQQIHYRSTKKIFQKMLDAAKLKRLTPENFNQFEEKAFSNLKLSASKYETIASILAFWSTHKLDWNGLSDAAVIENLSAIKGIGKWTTDMILLYTLQRPNVFPYDDFHLKQIMISLYDLNPSVKLKAQMLTISKDWGTYISLAVQYLLAWKDFNKITLKK